MHILRTSLLSHRPLSSSFLGLPYRILNINHKKELLRGLWVSSQTTSAIWGVHDSWIRRGFRERQGFTKDLWSALRSTTTTGKDVWDECAPSSLNPNNPT